MERGTRAGEGETGDVVERCLAECFSHVRALDARALTATLERGAAVVGHQLPDLLADTDKQTEVQQEEEIVTVCR